MSTGSAAAIKKIKSWLGLKEGPEVDRIILKTYNDYLVGVYDSPQLLQLEILSNQSGEEQILSFRVSDYLPFAIATVNIIQAAK